MDDKTIMTSILSNVKGACDLMMHGTIESSTSNVHSAFNTALQDCLCMQNDIYSKMSEKGWYTTQNADQSQIDSTKQKFSSSN